MIEFWLFGFMYNYFELVGDNVDRLNVKNNSTKDYLLVISVLT